MLRECDERAFGIGQTLGRFWYFVPRNAEEADDALGIGQQPCLQGTHRDSKTHARAGAREACPHQGRCTFSVLIEVSDHEPLTEPRSLVERKQLVVDILLSSQSVNHPHGEVVIEKDPANDGFVAHAFDDYAYVVHV